MSLLSRLFGSDDPLKPQAQRLVQSCAVLATTTYMPVTKAFPALAECSSDQWDFFATVGSVCVGLTGLLNKVPKERFRPLYGVVSGELACWNKQGEDAVQDCQKYIHNALKAAPGASPADMLGLWVLFNLLQRQPTEAEAAAAPGIGQTLAAPLHDWWT